MKSIKKVLLSSISILGLSCLIWVLLILNPSWSYANKTQFDIVTVYHNNNLEQQTKDVIIDAIALIKKSPLFNEKIRIDLCLNDDKLYPKLNPMVGQPYAYANLNKTVFKNCDVKFDENILETRWEVNKFEHRKFDLTTVLAHEFTHNLQYKTDFWYVVSGPLGKRNWRLEGHAEFVSLDFSGDGLLKEKVANYVIEETKEHAGLPVFNREDGTKQIFSYYKYALVYQYLTEVKGMNYKQICNLETDLTTLYADMVDWSKKNKIDLD